jgi:hypothetical protein
VLAGWVLLVVGLCWPWIQDGPWCDRPRHHGLAWMIDELEMELQRRLDPRWKDGTVEWWWSLPLAYGFALPRLWCSRYRHDTGARLVAGWACLVGILGALAWARWGIVLDWENMRSVARSCPQRSFFWSLEPRQPDFGFYATAVGALLVGLCPVIELQRLRGILTRWRARPGWAQAGRAIDRHALLRLSWPLRRLVCESRQLRASLSPLRPLDGEAMRRLAEIVGRLRALDDQARAELRDHGLCSSALFGALAPADPSRESSVEEALRVDEALTRLEAVGLRKDGVAPYR